MTGGRTPAGCIDLTRLDVAITVRGKLSERTFTDPYGTEYGLLLDLPAADCAEDSGEFADRADRFTQVQLASPDRATERALRRAVGRRVTVRGTAIAAHTRHHRRPVVLTVESWSRR